MSLFQLATETLETRLPFPELLPGGTHPTLRFELDGERPAPALAGQPLRSVELEDGSLWLAAGKAGDDYLLHFPRYADFLFSPAASLVTCFPAAGVDPATIRHLFLDHVFPLLLNRLGRTVLHASAVALPGLGAMAFVGKSGSGKSTIAAKLCAAGASLIADDCLVLQEASGLQQAVPMYPGLRLWDSSAEHLQWRADSFPAVASYTEKRKVALGSSGLQFADHPAELAAIFLLNHGWEDPDWIEAEQVDLQPLAPGEAMIRVLECTYCLDPGHRQRNELDFQLLARLVQTVPVMLARFPYDFAQLPSLCEAVLSSPKLP